MVLCIFIFDVVALFIDILSVFVHTVNARDGIIAIFVVVVKNFVVVTVILEVVVILHGVVDVNP